MELFLTPALTMRLVTNLVMLVGVVYLFFLKDRSGDTLRIMVYIGLFILAGLVQDIGELVLGDTLQSTRYGITNIILSLFYSALFAGIWMVCRLRFRLPVWEERIILGVMGTWYVVAVGLQLLYVFNKTYGYSLSLAFFPAAFAVLELVLLQKVWMAFRKRHPVGTRRFIVMALAAQLMLFVVTLLVLGIVTIQLDSQSMLFTLSYLSAFGLLFLAVLLYGEERHTVQAKVMGVLLVAYVFVFSISIATLYPPIQGVKDIRTALPAWALDIEPDTTGGYRISPAALAWQTPGSERLAIEESSPLRSALPFSFPFYGTRYDTIFISLEGGIRFGGTLGATAFTDSTLQQPLPFVTALTAHLHDDNPGSGVFMTVDDTAVVVTWQNLNDYRFQEQRVSMQVILYPDGRMRLQHPELSLELLEYARGIWPGGEQATAPLDDQPFVRGAGVAAMESFDAMPVYFDNLHDRSVPLMRGALWGLFFIGGGGLLFFRIALVTPLTQVLHGLQKVEQGELETEVHISERNELGALAEYFNRMTASLRSYSSEMEALVVARTEALQQSLEDLQTTQTQLVQQEKMASLGQLTAGIAHEIKNPLNFINNFAEVNEELADELREDLANHPAALASIEDLLDDLKQNAAVIAQHGKRADGIVRSMMAHARSGSGEKQAVDLNALIGEHIDLAYHGKRAQIQGFSVDIVRDFDASVGHVQVLPQELGRVVLNLLSNAFDALAEARTSDAAVTVTTKRMGDQVEIRVADNGPGMPDEVKAKVFEPFFTTKPTGQGTGLGLSMSYDIITQGHGGTMAVESDVGIGAAFIIILPLFSASNYTEL